MDANTILDMITIATSLITILFFFENFIIFFTSKEVTKLWFQMFIWRQPGFIRWCADGSWKFQLAYPDKLNPKKWSLKQGDKEIPYELKKGSVGIGPGKVALALIADEGAGAATIPLNELLAHQSIGATPAHVSAVEKSAYAEGYMEGFNKSNPEGIFEWAKDNWQIIAVFFILIVIGVLTMYDKVISSPAAWSAANVCEQQKAILLGKLGQCGGDISSIVNPVTTTTLPPQAFSGTGIKIV